MKLVGDRVQAQLGAIPLVVSSALVAFALGITSCTGQPPFSSCALALYEFVLRDTLLIGGILGIGLGVGLLVAAMLRDQQDKTQDRRHTPGRSAQIRPPVRRRRSFVVGIAVVVALAGSLALVLVPVPQQFSLHEVAVYDLEIGCGGVFTAQGTTVSFHWSAPALISFGAWSCSANQMVYWGNGTSGSGSFVSPGGVYEFGTICPPMGSCWPANVSGAYTAPILPL